MDRESGAVSPLVTALLAIPLVPHPCCNIRPGYPSGGAALLGHHRSDNRGQLLDFLTGPGAYVYVIVVNSRYLRRAPRQIADKGSPLRRSLRCARWFR